MFVGGNAVPLCDVEFFDPLSRDSNCFVRNKDLENPSVAYCGRRKMESEYSTKRRRRRRKKKKKAEKKWKKWM
jgi:hypothetical protein